jgi:hypothetical protein
MNQINQLQRLFFVGLLVWASSTMMAGVPDQLKFTAVFNYNDVPVSGNQAVTVRFLSDDHVLHQHRLTNVPFNHGVADIIVPTNDFPPSLFDNSNLQLKLTVRQESLQFPLNPVPYTIHAKESNKARRLGHDDMMVFDEPQRRVGIRTQTPQVSLDVAGGMMIGAKQSQALPSNGEIQWDATTNRFLGYKDNDWVSMSWSPTPEHRSKWTRNGPSIYTTKNVGIGADPGTIALLVTPNAYVVEDLVVSGSAWVGNAIQALSSDHQFSSGNVMSSVAVLQAPGNTWDVSGVTFSGVLSGDGRDITNVQHFMDESFQARHIQENAVTGTHFMPESVQSHHLANDSVTIDHVKPATIDSAVIQPNSLTAASFDEGAIESRHMKRQSLSSEDIALVQFSIATFQDQAIQSRHVVNGHVTGQKLNDNAVQSRHIQSGQISSNHIQDGQLTGAHVPTGSVPLSLYTGHVPILQGGMGASLSSDQGVVYIDGNGAYAADADRMMIHNGQWVIGGTRDAENNHAWVNVRGDDMTQVGVVADDGELAQLIMKNQHNNVTFFVDNTRQLKMTWDQDHWLTLTDQQRMGVGVLSPTEALSLNGPLVIGPSDGNISGSIRYQAEQFWVNQGNSWESISPGAASYRSVSPDDLNNTLESSVVSAQDTHMVGRALFVRSATSATVVGDHLDVLSINESSVMGGHSQGHHMTRSTIKTQWSNTQFATDANVDVRHSQVTQVAQSQGQWVNANAHNVSKSQVIGTASRMAFLTNSSAIIQGSDTSFLEASDLIVSGSQARHLYNVDARVTGSQVSQVTGVSGDIHSSIVSHVNDSHVQVESSRLTHVTRGVIKGRNHTVLGGDSHVISGEGHMSLSGDRHDLSGNRMVALGDDIVGRHDDAILINASDTPLVSDRPGQLKIQATNGVGIQWASGPTLAMVNDGGWSHVSDQALKTGLSPVDPSLIMTRVQTLPLSYWSYKSQTTGRHLGPMAQDFYALFSYGNSDKTIHSMDADGVLLATIQGVHDRLERMAASLKTQTEAGHIDDLQHADIAKKWQALTDRLTALDHKYTHYHRRIGQFESDNDTQDVMISYLQSTVFKWRWYQRLMQLSQWRGGLLLLGVVMGMGMAWAQRGRYS